MEKRFVLSAAIVLYSCAINAGVLKDETDRFSGTRSVSWRSMPQGVEPFSLSATVFYPKGYAVPYSYDIQLVSVSDHSRYRECHHTYWLVDGAPDPYLEMTYSETSGGSASIERFSKSVDRQNLERIAAAKVIEFQICGVEGSVSDQDMDGLRQVLAATK